MAHYWTDNVHTTALTPRDYQVELLAAASEKNIIVCLGHNSSKEFIAQKLIHEKAHELRRLENRKNSIYICNDGDSTYNLVFHLTDLTVINLNMINYDDIPWSTVLDDHQVVVLSAKLCLDALICSYIDFERINLIIIEDCHLTHSRTEFDEILNFYKLITAEKPIILGLAGPLHSAGCDPGHLGAELEHLEKALECKAETASDIVTVLRYCTTPIEIILQCAPPTECEVTTFLRDLINTQLAFLKEHRFDPSEIYSDEFLEEIKSYPDPKEEPLNALQEYLDVLNELGPWCADRAALNLLLKIEKFKVKTPYERHFLLLCMISTTFVQIRSYCDYIFQQLPTEKERIEKYSTPKVLRLLEILKLFKNPKDVTAETIEDSNLKESTKAVLSELNTLDFKRLETSIQTVEKNLPNSTDSTVVQIKENMVKLLIDRRPKAMNRCSPSKQRQRYRPHNRPQQLRQRSYWYNQNDSDSLCGLIFCNSKFIAKILYNLLYEMSKNSTELDYLGVQFTVDRVADPLTEMKEAEIEHRKQEEVLKRFRMHECNLLIGTSVLEEGIDLPKCNLVIRWDAPTTYRSYVQCKGRARATNAYHIILVAPTPSSDICQPLDENSQYISAKSHRLVCAPDASFPEKYEKYEEAHNLHHRNDGNENYIETIDHLFSNDVAAEIVELPSTPIVLVNGQSLDNEMDSNDESNHQQKKPLALQLYDKFKCVADCDELPPPISNNKMLVNDMEDCTENMVQRLAEYMEIEKVKPKLLSKCF